MPAVLTPMSKALELTDLTAGLGMSAFMLGYFISAPIFGYLGDIYSRKWLLLAGVIIWSIATTLTGLAQSIYDLLAIRIFVGVGEACFVMISPAWISDLYPSTQRNNALTFFYTAVPLGGALGYVFGGRFAQPDLWRYSFIFAGLPGIVLALTLLLLKEPARGASDGEIEQPSKTETGLHHLLAMISAPNFIMLTAGYTGVVFAIGAFSGWVITFLVRLHGMEAKDASDIFGTLLATTGLAATLIGGYIATLLRARSQRGYAWVLFGSVAPAVPISIFAFVTPSTNLCLICLGVCMFLLFLPTAPATSQLYDIVPGPDRAKATGIMTFFLHLFGDWLSPLLVGFISTVTVGFYTIPEQSLQLGLFVLPLALLAAAGFWGLLLRTLPHKDEREV